MQLKYVSLRLLFSYLIELCGDMYTCVMWTIHDRYTLIYKPFLYWHCLTLNKVYYTFANIMDDTLYSSFTVDKAHLYYNRRAHQNCVKILLKSFPSSWLYCVAVLVIAGVVWFHAIIAIVQCIHESQFIYCTPRMVKKSSLFFLGCS